MVKNLKSLYLHNERVTLDKSLREKEKMLSEINNLGRCERRRREREIEERFYWELMDERSYWKMGKGQRREIKEFAECLEQSDKQKPKT